VRRAFLTLAFLALTSIAALARNPWYYPGSSHHSYVNPFLTPRRALEAPWQSRWEGQLVLWQGQATKVRRERPQSLTLKLENGQSVSVRFSRNVKNLQVDRENATLAIKGHLRRSKAGEVHLEGRSVIPWSPAGGFQPGSPVIDQWIAFSRPELNPSTRQTIAEAIRREAKAANLDPLFLTALIQIESGFDPKAVSVSGALGLGQLMPETAAGLGVDATQIKDNVRGCARMLGGLVRRYSHRSDGRALALASYNAGPTLVAETLRVPPYEQTINYVYFIGALHHQLQRQEKLLRSRSSSKG
jgi:soluble lytic murein transglycosylase-like protein